MPKQDRKKKGVGGAPVTTSRRARVILVLGGVAFALAVAEITARALVPEPPAPRVMEPTGISPFSETLKGVAVNRPGASYSHVYDVRSDRRGYFGADGRVDYRINQLGLRGKEIPFEKPPGVRRILCVGDSVTFGEGVREEDTWPERLGRLLGPGTQILNAGVQGYDLDHEGLYLHLYGRQLKPDVVVLGFFLNDAMPPRETVAHHQLLTDTASELAGLSRVSASWRFLARRRFAARQTSRYLGDLRRSFSSQGWREARARIPRLRRMADQDGFRIVAVIFPLLYKLDDYPLEPEHLEVKSAFAAAGIEAVDLLDSFRGREAEDLWAHPVDPHPNEIAHGIAAERLAHLLAAANE
jgi:hypothetical protein